MRLCKKWAILFSLIGLQALPTLAADPDLIDQNGFRAAYKQLDIDSNGRLSFAEASKEKIFSDGFSKADKNKNNTLNYDEYASYKSQQQDKESRRVVSDSTITSKIKSKFLLEKGLSSFKVSVETKDGMVILSGFVENAALKARAEQIAASVSGVKSVKSALVIKP